MSKKTPIPPNPTWVTVVDGWVRDPKIRLDALIALAMLLAAAAITIALTTGAAAAAINVLLPSVFSKMVAGSVTTGAGCAWICWQRRKRSRAATAAPALLPHQRSNPATPEAADDGEPRVIPTATDDTAA